MGNHFNGGVCDLDEEKQSLIRFDAEVNWQKSSSSATFTRPEDGGCKFETMNYHTE
jgi:hypothetical protein